jgi:hypothetical protein
MINYFGNDVRESLAAYGTAWTLFLTDTDVLTSHSDLLAHSMNVIPMTVDFTTAFSWATSRSIFGTHLPHVDQDSGIVNYVAEITSPVVATSLSARATILLQNGTGDLVLTGNSVSLGVSQESQRFYMSVLPTASIQVSNGTDNVVVTESGYYDLIGTNFTVVGSGTVTKLRFLTDSKPVGVSTFTHAVLIPDSASNRAWSATPYFVVDLSEGPMIFSRRTITRNERVTIRAGSFGDQAVMEPA